MFSAEVKINGEFAKVAIKKHRFGYGIDENYCADISDVNIHRSFDADDMRTLAYELINVVDKIDKFNEVKK